MTKFFKIMIFIGLLVTACGKAPTVEQIYPAPEEVNQTTDDTYPVPESPDSAAYPEPDLPAEASVDIVPFTINKPVLAGDAMITGQGPAGLPIVIIDITVNGEILGEGFIDDDGTYTLPLSEPLELDHWIGITLNDLAGTQWESNNFTDQGFYGEEYQQVPTVGFLFDTTMVVKK